MVEECVSMTLSRLSRKERMWEKNTQENESES